MTGNNKFWRASLAGLASVAMLATMGVAANTANAAVNNPGVDVTGTILGGGKFTVAVYRADTPYTPYSGYPTNPEYVYGQTFIPGQLNDPYKSDADKILTGYSYDLAGKNVASSDGIAVKGDTKLFAQYANASVVTFNYPDGTTKTVKVKTGDGVTEYIADAPRRQRSDSRPVGCLCDASRH
ncbi:hypothetical protein [Bifidobacterium vespertilionis]|uniref:Uncharacterized protein n=1 Tax=Bifidobacterium vespertilionis TaxID=2562524 RepID=A0A5J5DX57_9BIFI|nr:hypothetical protein [Bifidobacterium vespertilionis]KAA8819012.1 hypothetical protein EMO90_08630 [Bifidobacterium vespertilionis]KAA8821454.1 hypothetical protein EM848_10875 [Bifidobacterium vespertilionis]